MQPHDDPLGQLGTPLLDGDDPAHDQLGGIATAVERPLDEDDRVVLDQVGHLGELFRPEHGRRRAAQVLEGELGHPGQPGPALLDRLQRHVDDDTAEGDLGLLFHGAKVGDAVRRQRLEFLGVAGQRVARHVEAQRLLLVGQPLGLGLLGNVGEVARRRGMAVAVTIPVSLAVPVVGGLLEDVEENPR